MPSIERDQQHEAAGADDVVRVALDHAVVDDVRVEAGQVQVGDGLDRHQDQHDAERQPVGPQVLGRSLVIGVGLRDGHWWAFLGY
jgi:hypothetical protein